jgi:hypothetical protein
MGRKLTEAEIRAYEELASAARKLREAQRAAELERQAKRGEGANLSLYAPNKKKEGGRA